MRGLALRRLPVGAWQPLVLYAVLLAAAGAGLWLNLGTLTHGYSAHEAAALQGAHSWRTIFNHPLNAPYSVLVRLILYVRPDDLLATRIAATIVGMATLVCFYLLVKHWHGERTALMGSIIFGGSAWFLHASRLGSPDVLLFVWFMLTAAIVWHRHTDNPLALLLVFLLGAGLLYVPGMIWLVLAGVLWQWKSIDKTFMRHLWIVTLGALLLVAMLAPLGLAIYHNPQLAKQVAGLPAHGWPQPLTVLFDLLRAPAAFFFRAPLSPEHWLAKVPVLSAFSMAMALLGAYLYARHLNLDRARLMAVVLVVGTVLVALGGAVSITLLVPFVYVLVAAGMGFMLDRWFKVFPRNTIAQTTGAVLISLALAAAVGLNLRHYFVAWPHAPLTKQSFTIAPPPATSGTIKL